MPLQSRVHTEVIQPSNKELCSIYVPHITNIFNAVQVRYISHLG